MCHKHIDNQSMSFQCEALLEKVEINCDQADVYKDEITIKTAKTLTKMMRIRKSLMKEKSGEPETISEEWKIGTGKVKDC